MRLLHSVPISNQSTTFYLPVAQYGSLVVEYNVTTSTGNAMTRANAGNVILNFNNKDVVNVDAEFLNLVGNLYGGVTKFVSTTAGANYMFTPIPLSSWSDSTNILDVSENDKCYIKLDFSSLSAISASGSVNIYGKTKLGVMNYLHKITSRNIIVSGATTFTDSMLVNNVSQLYLKAPSNVSNVQILKDGETIVDCSVELINNYSDFVHQLESTQSLIAIDFAETKDLREVLGTQISYKYTFTAATTLNQYFSFLEFTQAKAIESKNKTLNKIQSKLN